MQLPPLPDPLDPTRRALHGYARAVGALPRAHAPARPHWWHLGLEVRPDGLATVPVPLPGGGAMAVRLDPIAGSVAVASSHHDPATIDLEQATPLDVADRVERYAAAAGLPAELDRSRIPDDPVAVDRDVAAGYQRVLVELAAVLERRRSALGGTATGPLLVWPHGFDLAFEWFGTRRVPGEDGESAPAQLNLGFSPDDGGYLYSNPWPFEPALASAPLPVGAWHLEGWQGTILPYDEVAGRDDGADLVLAYAEAVHRVARPTLDT